MNSLSTKYWNKSKASLTIYLKILQKKKMTKKIMKVNNKMKKKKKYFQSIFWSLKLLESQECIIMMFLN
jgi:hypothetical protein